MTFDLWPFDFKKKYLYLVSSAVLAHPGFEESFFRRFFHFTLILSIEKGLNSISLFILNVRMILCYFFDVPLFFTRSLIYQALYLCSINDLVMNSFQSCDVGFWFAFTPTFISLYFVFMFALCIYLYLYILNFYIFFSILSMFQLELFLLILLIYVCPT